MKLRLLCVAAALSVCAGLAHAADAGKDAGKADGDSGAKKLTIPSMEMGGGSLGVSTDEPNNPDVPKFNDPAKQDQPIKPYFGLKFTKPLDGK